MRTSERIDELTSALAVARGEMPSPKHNRENPSYGSTYADLAAIHEASAGPLAAHGLAAPQCVECDSAAVVVTTRLLHVSGQWIETTAQYPAKGLDIQGVGAIATYLRRYALSAILQLAGEVDSDGRIPGAAANGSGQQKTSRAAPFTAATALANMAKLTTAAGLRTLTVKILSSLEPEAQRQATAAMVVAKMLDLSDVALENAKTAEDVNKIVKWYKEWQHNGASVVPPETIQALDACAAKRIHVIQGGAAQ